MDHPKFIQICTSVEGNCENLYTLDEDGDVWERIIGRWERLSDERE